ncbi:hypothetical protein AVEN_133760-1, partial [Araneus ventricosus]
HSSSSVQFSSAQFSSVQVQVQVQFKFSSVQLSSVTLTSLFQATRGLFWDGPRNFEPRSDDEDDTSAGTPSPNFRITSEGG